MITRLLGFALKEGLVERRRRPTTTQGWPRTWIDPRPERRLRRVAPDTPRQAFDAFALRVEYDRAGGRVQISAAVDDALAEALVGARELPPVICADGHGGGRIRTFEGRANAFTARPL